MKKTLFLSIFAFHIFFTSAHACTGLKLTAKDGTSVRGRTFEFGVKVETDIVVIPQGYSFEGTLPKGKGMRYQSKYAAVGSMCFGSPIILDGMNEMGLSVGTFYFPGYASYVEVTNENKDRALSPVDFPNWILTQFGTLEEVKAHLADVVIAPTIIKQWGSTPPPFHYLVYDKTGKSIVIEPLEGKLVVSDNSLGVLTNSPTFDWHMTNLRNYINLTAKNVPPLKIDDLVLAPFGQGSGMVGLPGDFTPPSRFVRAAIYSIAAIPSATGNEAVAQLFHILNQFDIPVGVAREKRNDITYTDYTLATVVHDPANLKYYFKTYEDQTIKVVDLKAFDKKAKEIKKMAAAGKQSYIDISKDLAPLPK